MTTREKGHISATTMLRIMVPVLNRIEDSEHHVQGVVFQIEVHRLTDERETVAFHTPRYEISA